MSYKVIHYFTDLQDFNHPYNVGDIFPRKGLKVTDERLKELAGKNNKQGTALIAEEKEATAKTEEVAFNHSKTEINRMSTAELHELAKSLNVANEAEMSGANLKEYFISTYNL